MPDFDAIIVGSGISGGWVAKELCERGLKVCVLERGSDLDPVSDYSDNIDPWDMKHFDRVSPNDIKADYDVQSTSYAFKESNKHLWIKDSDQPYEVGDTTNFKWRRGSRVGGRSLLWGRASFRLAPHDFEANKLDGHGVDWPVRYDDIAPWYDHVEKFVGIAGRDDGLAQLPGGEHYLPPFDLTCAEQALKAEMAKNFPNRDLIIARVANLKRLTEEQQALGRGQCQARNKCFHGCSYGAYFSSNSATLPAAKRTGNLTLVSNAIVTKLNYDSDGNRVSSVEVIDSQTKDATTYSAKIVFLNASTISSAMLLLNSDSERFPSGLANRSDQVGRNLMDHVGGVWVEARVPGHKDKYVYGRRPTNAYIPRFRNFPDQQEDYQRGFAYQVYSGRSGAGGWHSGIGKAFKDANRTPGDWRIVLDGFGEILPHPDNRVTLHKTKTDRWGQPIAFVDAPMRENEIALMKAAQKDAVDILTQAGFEDINPGKTPTDDGLSLGRRTHEMGTIRMGRDPKTSVLNGWNQAHDIPNLFVTDGSFMTSSAVQNPSLSYMAFSARAANHAADLLREGVL
ncbi:MAG: GMC family oxidoreductase [Hellea sp.]